MALLGELPANAVFYGKTCSGSSPSSGTPRTVISRIAKGYLERGIAQNAFRRRASGAARQNRDPEWCDSFRPHRMTPVLTR